MIPVILPPMRLCAGFTGTREGITSFQRGNLMQLLAAAVPVELHHGDCKGADAEAHSMADGLLIPVIIHPPVKDDYRAFCWSHDIREPKPYLDRDRDIVEETSYLIACPKQDTPRSGGTWYTVDYAIRTGKPVYLLYPDGRVDRIPVGGVLFP